MCEEIARISIIFCRYEKIHFQHFDGTRNGNIFCAGRTTALSDRKNKNPIIVSDVR